MQKRIVAYYVGQLFIILAFFMVAPILLAIHDNATTTMYAYGISAAISLLVGISLRVGSKKLKVDHLKISRKEAFGIVGFGWIGTGIMSGLPFVFEGSIPNLVSSTFEAISGLTTTGATVVADVEGLSRATNLWRVLRHWIGGMGIVVLFVAIFPQLGLGGKHLFKTEVAGPINEGLKPRIKQTALRLWWLYAFFTTACTGLLVLAGLPIFDAVCHALSTLSTGGFSTKSASMGAFENPLAEWIVIFFMIIGGISFNLYYGLFRGQVSKLFKSVEVRLFVGINAVVALTIFLATAHRDYHAWHEDLRDALFQTAAITTTTGLMTADFDAYPIVSKYLLFLCMFVGGCAGSTAGGLKVSRVLIVFKRCLQELRLTLHPQEVVSTKLGKQKVSRGIINSVFIFVCTYFLLYLFGVFIMFALGMDWVAASSRGPGFGAVGPTQNYEFVHPLGKIVLCFYMIAGRLEIFVLLSMFTPSFWRKGG
ncbi:MAG: TrkH family potassium uptake protein [Bdellovibrionales bacterium]|nr:TrkH family potassium uptake protein [Bdellovibrionales bacterium]